MPISIDHTTLVGTRRALDPAGVAPALISWLVLFSRQRLGFFHTPSQFLNAAVALPELTAEHTCRLKAGTPFPSTTQQVYLFLELGLFSVSVGELITKAELLRG